jgi:hypothetical protein
MRAVSRGLRRHFPWNDRVWLVRGGAVALSPKRIAAICRSTSLLQERARDFVRGTHSLKPNFVSVTVFPCASSKLCFCGYPHPQSTEWDGGRENLLDVILWFTLLRRLLALNVIHGASKVWSLSDRLTQRRPQHRPTTMLLSPFSGSPAGVKAIPMV